MVTTHPIQYQVPWLKLLGAQPGIELQVYFAMHPDSREQGREFGVSFVWDTPLLDGYSSALLDNRARRPSLTEWSGCDTPGIAGKLREGRFDAVIVNGWGSKTAVQALIACRRLGIPCLVRGEANGLRPRTGVKRLAHSALLRQYAAFLAIGRQNRAYYESLGVNPRRIFATPYCVDNERFSSSARAVLSHETQGAIRCSLGLDPEAVTFLFSGKFVDKKHPADAIEAVRRLSRGGLSGVQLLMVGDGPLRPVLEEAAAGLPIVFSGFLNQSQIPRAYAASNCLLLPSDAGETWGLVVNEAMACGLPAIVSNQVGCAVDLVEPDVTGQIFPCRDVDALAAAMEEGVRHPERLATWGEHARSRVFGKFNFERVVAGVMEALRSVVR